MRLFIFLILTVFCLSISFSQKKDKKTSTTGWQYNDESDNNISTKELSKKVKVPKGAEKYFDGVKLIQGGIFSMGRIQPVDVKNSDSTLIATVLPRRVTISSYYISDHEVTNKEYREFVNWVRDYTARSLLAKKYPDYYVEGTKILKKNTPIDWNDEALKPMFDSIESRFYRKNALRTNLLIYYYKPDYTDLEDTLLSGIAIYPDTLCWTKEMQYSFNEPFQKMYYWHPSLDNFPVNGVSWEQANAYCKWRTDRLNEQILIANKVDIGDGYFSTEEYLLGKYKEVQEVTNNPFVGVQDNLLFPNFRLPTEAEWEYAAKNIEEERGERVFFPWNGFKLTDDKGMYLANFGPIVDQNGLRVKPFGNEIISVIAKKSNTGNNEYYNYTTPVKSFPANDKGLFDMAGNVAEWVLDVYRPYSSYNFDEFRPFRGRNFNSSNGKIENDTSIYSDGWDTFRYGDTIKVTNYLTKKTEQVIVGSREHNRLIYIEDSIKKSYIIQPDDNPHTAMRKMMENRHMYNDAETMDTVRFKERYLKEAELLIHDAQVGKRFPHGRIVKGGSWLNGPSYIQSGAREVYDQKKGYSRVGFRVAMTCVGSYN